jgi:rRNA maturation endonuclease Nob1
MTLLIGILMMVVAAAFVAAPFFTGAGAVSLDSVTSRGQLQRQKHEAYAAIKEAEFDHRMGKLSDADFAVLREKYTAQAVEAIAGLEAQSTQRRQLGATKPTSRIAFCPACGHQVPPRANFCPACGGALNVAVA